MKKLKTMAVLLAAILLVQSLFASNGAVYAASALTIGGGSVSAKAGDTISVPVRISGNTGIMGLGVTITYDSNKFSSPSVTRGAVCAEGQFNDSITTSTSGSFIVMWSGTDEVKQNGVLFTISLKVQSGVSAGNNAIGIANRKGDTFDGQYNDITPSCQSVAVTVTAASSQSGTGSADNSGSGGNSGSSGTNQTTSKGTTTIYAYNKTATYTGKRIKLDYAVVKGSSGSVYFNYYKDAACKNYITTNAGVVNAGTYYVVVSVDADNNYKAAKSKPVKLVIKKASQSISGVKTKLTAKKNSKKTQSFSLGGKAKGKLTYKLSGSSKYKIKVSSAGKLTLPKKMKKGTYKVTVKITAKATSNYKSMSAKKPIKITVK